MLQRFHAANSSITDQIITMEDEPCHQELCNLEQIFLLRAIQEDLDLTKHLNDAIDCLKIVLAADESIKTNSVIKL